MDLSANKFDLQYLTNPSFINQISCKNTHARISTEDLNFYKKRIFKVTKEYLRGKKRELDLDKDFEAYAFSCIEYFKFIDKAEVIQEEYNSMPSGRTSTIIDLSGVDICNNMMMKKRNDPIPKITDHINIKSTKTVKKIVLPQVRNINIKTTKFKNKTF
jgi:hypothetical protein